MKVVTSFRWAERDREDAEELRRRMGLRSRGAVLRHLLDEAATAAGLRQREKAVPDDRRR